MKLDSMNEKFPRMDVKISDQLIQVKNIIDRRIKKVDKEIRGDMAKQESQTKVKVETLNRKLTKSLDERIGEIKNIILVLRGDIDQALKTGTQMTEQLENLKGMEREDSKNEEENLVFPDSLIKSSDDGDSQEDGKGVQ